MRNLLGLIVLSLLVSCGKNPNTITPSAQMQSELSYVLNETLKQTAIASSFATNKNLSTASALASATALATAVSPACQTSVGLHLIGVDLTFKDSSSCLIAGTVSLNFIPLSVSVDIESTKLSFINSFQAKGTLGLGNGSLNLQFLDGRISLRNLISLPWQDLVMNGRLAGSWMSGGFGWTARANAFESASAMGVALIKKDTSLQSCFLTGGDPKNIDAGNLVACIGK